MMGLYRRDGAASRSPGRRYLAAMGAESRPCEGEPDEVRVIDRIGQGTAACRLHGAVLLASLEGGRIVPGCGGNSAVMVVRCRAREMRRFDGVWTGPGVQRMNSLKEAAVFPSAPCPLPPEPCLRSSGPGNAPRARWAAGQRYQAGHLPGGAADNLGDAALGTGSKEVETR
jgi:hypothetical protein